MGGEHVSKSALTLKNGARLAQLSLGMLRSDLDTEFLYLLIGHTCHAAARNKQTAVSRLRIDQPQYPVTDATNDGVFITVVRIADHLTENGALCQIIRGTPSS